MVPEEPATEPARVGDPYGDLREGRDCPSELPHTRATQGFGLKGARFTGWRASSRRTAPEEGGFPPWRRNARLIGMQKQAFGRAKQEGRRGFSPYRPRRYPPADLPRPKPLVSPVWAGPLRSALSQRLSADLQRQRSQGLAAATPIRRRTSPEMANFSQRRDDQ